MFVPLISPRDGTVRLRREGARNGLDSLLICHIWLYLLRALSPSDIPVPLQKLRIYNGNNSKNQATACSIGAAVLDCGVVICSWNRRTSSSLLESYWIGLRNLDQSLGNYSQIHGQFLREPKDFK